MAGSRRITLDNSLCFAVYSANLAFARVYRPLLDALGLTYVQYLVLVALWERDGLLVGELGERLYLASNTLTPVIKRLEALGFVSRTRDTQDERQVRVALTKAGHGLQARASKVPDHVLDASALHLDDAMRMREDVTALRDHLFASTDVAATPNRPHHAAGRAGAAQAARKGLARCALGPATPRAPKRRNG